MPASAISLKAAIRTREATSLNIYLNGHSDSDVDFFYANLVSLFLRLIFFNGHSLYQSGPPRALNHSMYFNIRELKMVNRLCK